MVPALTPEPDALVVPITDINPTWIHSASTPQVWLLTAMAGGGVFGLGMLIERLLFRRGKSPLKLMAASNAVMGFLAGAMFGSALKRARESQRQLQGRLLMIGEMNHHIRNALQLIKLSAHGTENEQAIEQISSGIRRIEWALREVLPQG